MEKAIKGMNSLGKYIIALFIVLFVVHASAMVNFWYWAFPWLDIPMHFLGGFWAAMIFVFLDSKFKLGILKKKFFLNLLLIVSFVALIGVLWEFFEFSYDYFSNSMEISEIAQQGLTDTIGDLFFDLFGGIVFSFLVRASLKRAEVV